MDGTTATSADRYEDASRAAAAGGTTTIIDFAMQVEGEGLRGAARAPLRGHPPERRRRRAALLDARGQPAGAARAPGARRARRAFAQGVPGLQPARRADAGRGPARGLEGGGGRRRDHAGALRELADHPAAARGRAGRRRDGLRRLRRLAAAHLRGRRRGRARSRSRARPAPRPTASTSRRAGAVEHLRLARLHGLDVHGECCPHHLLLDESRYLGERARRLRDEPAAAHGRAPRGALGGPRGRHARGGRRRSRRLAGAAQGARAGLPRGGARRRGQRADAAAAGGAGRPGRGLRLGARRAPERREPRAHLPPARQGRDRAGQGCRSRRARARRTSGPCRRCRPTGGRQRDLPGPPARSAALGRAARPRDRAGRGVRRRAGRGAVSCPAPCNESGGMRDYPEHAIGGLEC